MLEAGDHEQIINICLSLTKVEAFLILVFSFLLSLRESLLVCRHHQLHRVLASVESRPCFNSLYSTSLS